MSLRFETPCDFGPCPYDAEYSSTCEYWCGTDEPEDYEDYYYTDEPHDLDMGFDPYMGCYTDDC